MKLRLKEIRKNLGISQERAAEAMGFSPPMYSMVERGVRTTTTDRLESFCSLSPDLELWHLFENPDNYKASQKTHLVPIVGQVQAGVWCEALEFAPDDIEYMPVTVPDKIKEKAYGLIVRGDSMDKIYEEGTILIICPLIYYPREIDTGCRVIVHRTKADGIVEATAKEIEITNGTARLWPRSSNPRWDKPIDIHWPNGVDKTDTEKVEIKGVVIGSYKQEIKL